MSTTDRTTSWLRDPRIEHDACGVGFVANIKGERVARASSSRGSRSCAT